MINKEFSFKKYELESFFIYDDNNDFVAELNMEYSNDYLNFLSLLLHIKEHNLTGWSLICDGEEYEIKNNGKIPDFNCKIDKLINHFNNNIFN